MNADERVQAELDRAAKAAREWSARNIAAGGVCDFCSHPLVPGHYATFVLRGLIVGHLSAIADDLGAGSVQLVSDPYWACCETCLPLVEAGDAEALVEHVIANRDREVVGPIPDEFVALLRSDLLDLYRSFYKLEPRREP